MAKTFIGMKIKPKEQVKEVPKENVKSTTKKKQKERQ